MSGEDVGQQLVDLSARARNLRAQSRALIRLMNQAVTVSDTIKIQNELFDIQGQIEELDGRLRYLHDQADMSTITMLLAQPAAAHHHHRTSRRAIGSALRRSWQRATDVVTAVIVGAGVVIPVALLALVALLAGRWLLPAVRRTAVAGAGRRGSKLREGRAAGRPLPHVARRRLVLILTPTHPAFETANVMLPALVGCTLKEAVPFEALSLRHVRHSGTGDHDLRARHHMAEPSLTVTLIVAVVFFGIAACWTRPRGAWRTPATGRRPRAGVAM